MMKMVAISISCIVSYEYYMFSLLYITTFFFLTEGKSKPRQNCSIWNLILRVTLILYTKKAKFYNSNLLGIDNFLYFFLVERTRCAFPYTVGFIVFKYAFI